MSSNHANNGGATNSTPVVPSSAPVAAGTTTIPTAFDLRFGNPSSITNPPRPVLGTPSTGHYSHIPDADQRFAMLARHFTTVGVQGTTPTTDEPGWKMDADALSKLKSP